MRFSLISAWLLVASCSPPGEENKAEGGADGAGPAAVVTAVSNAGRDCSIRWNGEAVSREALLDNGVKLIMRTIDDVGGIEKINEENMPYLRLEAAGEVPYACTGPALREIQRAGFAHAVLKPAGAQDQRVDFPLATQVPSRDRAIVRLEKGGRMTWDGEAIDGVGLGERARLARAMAPPVDIIVAPSAASDFTALHDAMRAFEREKVSAILSGCAGTTGPVLETSPIC